MDRSSVSCRFPLASLAFAAVLGLCLFIGCSTGGNFPVQGKVVDPSGQPIPGLEGSEIVLMQVDGISSSVAEIKADGRFDAYTVRPGDGVPPGNYTVHIPRRMIDPEHAAPQAIHAKYEKPETSGLELNVDKKLTGVELKVERVAGKGA